MAGPRKRTLAAGMYAAGSLGDIQPAKECPAFTHKGRSHEHAYAVGSSSVVCTLCGHVVSKSDYEAGRYDARYVRPRARPRRQPVLEPPPVSSWAVVYKAKHASAHWITLDGTLLCQAFRGWPPRQDKPDHYFRVEARKCRACALYLAKANSRRNWSWDMNAQLAVKLVHGPSK